MYKSQDELSKELNEASKSVEIGGLYVHYRNSDNVYKVLNLAITEADNKPCVIYEAQYGNKLIFVRPIENWLDTVEYNGQTVKRFTHLA